LQTALGAAVSGETIEVAQGTYYPTTTTDNTATFQLENGVEIDGGFAGAVNPTAARNVTEYSTVLSGVIGVNGSGNSFHVVTGSNVNATAVIDGLTITGGIAGGTNPVGGGMLLIASSPTLNDLTFTNNSAVAGGGLTCESSSSPSLNDCTFAYNSAPDGGRGGAVEISSSTPVLTNCTFNGNTATNTVGEPQISSGGAIYDINASPTMINCSFSDNSASGSNGVGIFNNPTGQGGAICNQKSSPILTNCSFTGNSGQSAGGGIYNNNSSPVLSGCTFTANTSASNGGGIYNNKSSPTLTGCIFIRNSAFGSGGAVCNVGSSPTLTNCTLDGNTTVGNGGAIYDESSAAVLTGCVIDGDSSEYGGVIYNSAYYAATSVQINDCTIAGDSGGSSGGAIVNYSYGGSASATVTNSIIWGDGPDEIVNTNGTSTTSSSTTATFSDIQGGMAGSGNLNANPFFVRNPNPGADGKWGTTDDDYGDLSLQSDSPCIDTGRSAAVPALLTTDITGKPRILGAAVDMGAYEFGTPTAPEFGSLDAATFATGLANSFTILTTGQPLAALGESGPLPAGISFTDNGNGTATIAGMPMAGGNGIYNLTLSASNGVSPDASEAFALTVGPPQAPSITSANTVTFVEGTAGVFTITTSGAPSNATITETGSLPGGIVLTSNGDGTASLSGMPVPGPGGNYVLSINANNGIAPAATQSLTLTLDAPPTITSANHVTFTAGAAGSFTIKSSGVPVAALTETGNLPAGVSLVDNGKGTATLSGTPTSVGNYNLSLSAANGIAPIGTQSFTLTVGSLPVFTSLPAVTFVIAKPNEFLITTTGFPTAALTETNSIPFGLTFTDNGNGTGILSGIAEGVKPGNYALSFTASNGTTPASTQNFTLTIEPTVPPIYYVDAHAPAGVQYGTSWANAFTSLQSALNIATFGAIIDVAQGTYTPTTGTSRTVTFTLDEGVEMYGGFAGDSTLTPAARNVSVYPTILSGNIGNLGGRGDNSYHVLTAISLDGSTVVDGFTITAGNATGSLGTQGYGGGLFEQAANVTVNDCIFKGNFAILGGALEGGAGQQQEITNCVFENNSAQAGGAISINSAVLSIVNCAFENNAATANDGGAIYSDSSAVTVINCSFTGNTSASFGGAIYSDQDLVTTPSTSMVINCILWGDSDASSNEIFADSNAILLVNFNDVQGGYPGTSNIDADPLFVNAGAGNLQLQAGSPCVNVGSNPAVPASVTTDLAGVPRIIDGTVDLGAYECTSVNWTDGGDGKSWGDPNNWSGEAVPSQYDSITIPAGVADIQIGNGGFTSGRLISSSPIEVLGTGTLVLYGSTLLNNSLAIDSGGSLDIQSYSLTINYAAGADPAATIRGYLKSAYAGGLWTGAGLTSSVVEGQVANAIKNPGGGVYAIGYLDGAVDVGQTAVVGDQMVIEPAIVGDTDLNGTNNFLDLGRVAQNLGKINSDWYHGDFNYDGSTNFLDIGLLAQNLNKTTVNTVLGGVVSAGAAVVASGVQAGGNPRIAIPKLSLRGEGNFQTVVSGVWVVKDKSGGGLFGEETIGELLA
jgi:predicted outer membrane repeat protein